MLWLKMGFPARVASFVFLGFIRVGVYTLESGILVETLMIDQHE